MSHDSASPDLHGSPLPDTRWSRRQLAWRFGGVVLCGLVVAAVSLLYDPPLKPWQDLEPSPVPSVPAAANGYLFLKKHWETADRLASTDWDRTMTLLQGAWARDEESMAEVLAGQEGVAAELETALAMQHWQVTPDKPPGDWLEEGTTIVQLLALRAMRAGDLEEAIRLQQGIHSLAERMIQGSRSRNVVSSAYRLRGISAALCCDLLANARLEPEQLARISRAWQEEPLTKSRLREALLVQAEEWRETINFTGKPLRNSFSKWQLRLLRPHRNLNRYHDIVRRAEAGLMETASRVEEALPGQIPELSREGTSKMDEIFINESVQRHAARQIAILQTTLAPLELFLTRAMRVRLALHRWQLAHGGACRKGSKPWFRSFCRNCRRIPGTENPWDGIRWPESSPRSAPIGGMILPVSIPAFRRGGFRELRIRRDCASNFLEHLTAAGIQIGARASGILQSARRGPPETRRWIRDFCGGAGAGEGDRGRR